MVDIVTAGNELLYRESFCVANNHTVECVNETVNIMAKMAHGVACNTDVPVEAILENIPVEQFELHLKEILAIKECSCKKTGYTDA